MFSSLHYDAKEIQLIFDKLHVKNRIFSSPEGGECSGFYTQLEDNVALAKLTNIQGQYCIQAKFSQLSSGEMGFVIFCDTVSKSLLVIEGFLYGDERVSIEGLMKAKHSFSIYALPGM